MVDLRLDLRVVLHARGRCGGIAVPQHPASGVRRELSARAAAALALAFKAQGHTHGAAHPSAVAAALPKLESATAKVFLVRCLWLRTTILDLHVPLLPHLDALESDALLDTPVVLHEHVHVLHLQQHPHAQPHPFHVSRKAWGRLHRPSFRRRIPVRAPEQPRLGRGITPLLPFIYCFPLVFGPASIALFHNPSSRTSVH